MVVFRLPFFSQARKANEIANTRRVLACVWLPCACSFGCGSSASLGVTRATTTNERRRQGQPPTQGKRGRPPPTTMKGNQHRNETAAYQPHRRQGFAPASPFSFGWRLSLSSLGWRPSVSSFGNNLLFPLQQGDLPCRPCQEVPWVPGSVNLFMIGLTENVVFRCSVFWVLSRSLSLYSLDEAVVSPHGTSGTKHVRISPQANACAALTRTPRRNAREAD